MYTGIFFSIEALFYLGLLLLVYFKKKVFKSRENMEDKFSWMTK